MDKNPIDLNEGKTVLIKEGTWTVLNVYGFALLGAYTLFLLIYNAIYSAFVFPEMAGHLGNKADSCLLRPISQLLQHSHRVLRALQLKK